MKIQDMFQKDINRDINGVVKVAQDDEASLKQELGEYIITKELRRHFETFFDNYEKAIGHPTDKIGVWISGFFGSGKSHFLKILSYLLANREVSGRRAIDFFEDKFDDPMMYAAARRCVGVPTESILFNIDVEGPLNKDKTAVLRVFAKMFYNHLGYYGEDLKIAKLERFIDKQGKTEAFRAEFGKINGAPWLEARSTYAFFEDDIVKVLTSVLGMSETSARNWFNGEENADMSIKQLVSEIKEYVDEKNKGRDFRLLFMVDEVGQYIGEDGNLMINLQSIVEEVGEKCRGKVWVMVTSQEAIDSVVKITGDDFSKIQGRFNTRLSLSSSSVDEVIKKRVLAKTQDAENLLRMVHDKEHAVLKNLFTFNNPILDIKDFSDSGDFSATYPFVPYQFIIIQKVLAEIRKHGNAGKHLSGGERSMLSGFQETAQKIQAKDENALVPFHQFYDTVHTFLESPIRRVIDRCHTATGNRDGLEPRDADVLKLLYLIRYIEDVRANIDNIAILMIEDIRADKIELRESVKKSLERLLAQNYVSRNDDVYAFLTDEEQDIARDIHNTSVDNDTIIRSISAIVYDKIYTAKKYKCGKYDFAYDQYVDGVVKGSAGGGMILRIVTVANDYYKAPENKFLLDSTRGEAVVRLGGEAPYFEELEQAGKIQKYVKLKNVAQLPENIQDIISKRQKEAKELERRAEQSIEKAIENAAFYVYGEKLAIKYGSAKEKLDEALAHMVHGVYEKLEMVSSFVESDDDIQKILNEREDLDSSPVNKDALIEISQWLELQNNRHLPTSMGDVQRRYGAAPYGWREIDIAALVARLIAGQKISVQYGGATVARDDRKLVDYLRKKTEVDKAAVTRRIFPSKDLMRKSVAFLREYLGVMDIPSNEDELIGFVTEKLTKKANEYRKLIDAEYARAPYPQKETVTAAGDLINDILSQRTDSVALLTRLTQKQDALMDSAEDMEKIHTFFNTQKTTFDEALKLQNSLLEERNAFTPDAAASEKIAEITAILTAPKPYGRIKDLPELTQAVRAAYGESLDRKRAEVMEVIQHCLGDIHTLAGTGSATRGEVTNADNYFTKKKKEAAEDTSLMRLDAMMNQLRSSSESTCKRIEKTLASSSNDGPAEVTQRKIAQIRRYDVFTVKRLQSCGDVDDYLDGIREKLYDALEKNDSVQLI